jgi:hypothetical protein
VDTIAQRIKELQRVLAHRPELWGEGSFDWRALEQQLAELERLVTRHIEGRTPRPRRGRTPLDWRDDLVSLAYSLYPEGEAAKSEGSHFESTVAMLLQYLDAEVNDVHSVVVDALRRQPEPPFRVSRQVP